jgi:cyanophycin synthetase
MNPGRRTLKLLRFKYLVHKRLDRLRGREAGIDMNTLTDFYKRVWEDSAREIHADFKELSRGIWKVSRDGVSTYINNYIVQIDDPVLLNLAGDKPLCYSLLKEAGLPVPEHETYTLDTIDKARTFMEGRGYLVIKPAYGTSGGRGITTHVKTFKEVVHASVLASLYSNEIIIERLATGESYRLLVLDGEMIHASRRRGLRVTGDGSSTIKDLAMGELATGGQFNGARPARLDTDRDTSATLGAQGLSAGSVPSPGVEVLVKSVTANNYMEVRTVYTEDATGLISEGLEEEAVKAARTIDSRFAGVDIVTPDPSVPLERAGGVIVEVNTTPGLHHHCNFDTNGAKVRTADKVLEYLLRDGSNRTPRPTRSSQ